MEIVRFVDGNSAVY